MRLPAMLLVLSFIPILASPAELTIELRHDGGDLVSGALVYAVPDERTSAAEAPTATMDQLNRQFVPHVLAVQTGTAVQFPNSDNVRHQVYSFSRAKRFQIPLYEGMPPEPVVLDKPGVLTLGCNIHDRMSAYIVVVDTPYFAMTEDGKATLTGLPAGSYSLHLWQPRAPAASQAQRVTLEPSEKLLVTLQTD